MRSRAHGDTCSANASTADCGSGNQGSCANRSTDCGFIVVICRFVGCIIIIVRGFVGCLIICRPDQTRCNQHARANGNASSPAGDRCAWRIESSVLACL